MIRGDRTPGRPEAAGARGTDAGDIEPPADPPAAGGGLGTRGAATDTAGPETKVPTGPSPAGPDARGRRDPETSAAGAPP